MKRGTRGMGRVYERGGVWWIRYSHKGVRTREPGGTKPEAVALLKRRFEELTKGRPVHEAAKVLLTDLRALIDADYKLNGRRSGKRLGQAWAHLVSFFGKHEPAVAVTAPRLAAYVTTRVDEGAASATIRNEVTALKRAFRLARKSGTLLPHEVPSDFPTLKATKKRSGFFERAEHEAVRAGLPRDEADVAEFLFWSGWRKEEALSLRWKDVDETVRVARIETTKTDEPRTLPYGSLPQLVELFERRRALTDAVQAQRGMIVTHVFHRDGKRITTFYRTWAAACVAAGLGHEERRPDVKTRAGKVRKGRLLRRVIARIPHDYRRSAARNLSRAGVPEGVIMQLCGWKTRSVFDRYRIVSERDLAEGLARLAEQPAAATPTKVRRINAEKLRKG